MMQKKKSRKKTLRLKEGGSGKDHQNPVGFFVCIIFSSKVTFMCSGVVKRTQICQKLWSIGHDESPVVMWNETLSDV